MINKDKGGTGSSIHKVAELRLFEKMTLQQTFKGYERVRKAFQVVRASKTISWFVWVIAGRLS